MNCIAKDARDWIVNSKRSSFFDVIQEAKISQRQMQIIELRFINGLMNYQIAARLNVSTRTVENDLQLAYRAVSRVLESEYKK